MPELDSPTLERAEPTPESFTIHFWGVRGSIPTPSADTVRYGGNTACVEMQIGTQRLIFDGGTGLHLLGKHLLQSPSPIEAYLFFTHTHWDRIQGFPFFIPAFSAQNRFYIYGGIAANGASIKQRLTDQMLRPNFPTPLQMMQSELIFDTIAPGSILTLAEDITVEAVSLNRPNGALGYRVTWGDYAVVYATDTDHTLTELDPALLYLAQGADVLIYDGTYADHAYYDLNTTRSATDTTWQMAVNLAKTAGVGRLVLSYHAPDHDDEYLDQMAVQVQSSFPQATLAREGMILRLDKSN